MGITYGNVKYSFSLISSIASQIHGIINKYCITFVLMTEYQNDLIIKSAYVRK